MNDNNATFLKILGIFDFILAGITLFYGAIYALYLVLMSVMFSDPDLFQNSYTDYSGYPNMYGQEFFSIFMGIFVAMFAFMLFLLLTFAISHILLGIFLIKKKNYYFCLVMASLTTLIPVLGTILGAFTLIILAQPATKELFQKGTPPPLASIPLIPAS